MFMSPWAQGQLKIQAGSEDRKIGISETCRQPSTDNKTGNRLVFTFYTEQRRNRVFGMEILRFLTR